MNKKLVHDTSILDEINADTEARKARIKYYVVFWVILLALVGTGVATALHGQSNRKDNKPVAVTSDQTEATANPAPTSTTTPASNPKTKANSTVASSPAPTVDVNALNAQLCASVIKSAETTSQANLQTYSQAFEHWRNDYSGRYDSPEAQEAKDWYKNYIKKLYSDLINSLSPSYNKNCSSGSVTDVIYQPNYDAWYQ